jgi:flagellar biogenesis protein FliO
MTRNFEKETASSPLPVRAPPAEALPVGGLAAWILVQLRGLKFGRLSLGRRVRPQLAVVERITLGPRQSLALIEAEGRRFLVATSPEGTPAFYPLGGERVGGERVGGERAGAAIKAETARRVSW